MPTHCAGGMCCKLSPDTASAAAQRDYLLEAACNALPAGASRKIGRPIGRPYLLAAAAVIVAAAVVIIVAAAAAQIAAAVAEQEDQDDDPVDVTAAEIIVAHKEYLQIRLAAKPLIPWYSAAVKG